MMAVAAGTSRLLELLRTHAGKPNLTKPRNVRKCAARPAGGDLRALQVVKDVGF